MFFLRFHLKSLISRPLAILATSTASFRSSLAILATSAVLGGHCSRLQKRLNGSHFGAPRPAFAVKNAICLLSWPSGGLGRGSVHKKCECPERFGHFWSEGLEQQLRREGTKKQQFSRSWSNERALMFFLRFYLVFLRFLQICHVFVSALEAKVSLSTAKQR